MRTKCIASHSFDRLSAWEVGEIYEAVGAQYRCRRHHPKMLWLDVGPPFIFLNFGKGVDVQHGGNEHGSEDEESRAKYFPSLMRSAKSEIDSKFLFITTWMAQPNHPPLIPLKTIPTSSSYPGWPQPTTTRIGVPTTSV